MHSHGRGTSLRPAHCESILDSVQDAVIATDADGDVIYVNDAARHLHGLDGLFGSASDRPNLRSFALATFEAYSPDGNPLTDFERLLASGMHGPPLKDVELLVRHRERDGLRMFVVSSRSLLEGDGIRVYTIRDDTDRWQAQRRFRVAFETDPSPRLVARLRDGKIVMANAGMSAFAGVPAEELLSATLTDVARLAPGDDLRDTLEALASGEQSKSYATTLGGASDGVIDVLVTARAIQMDGEACGIFTFLDVSDLERVRREQQEALAALAHVRSRLAEQRENERARIARSLHAGILQDLLAHQVNLGQAEQRYRASGNAEAAEAVAYCRDVVLTSAKELRNAIRRLRPAALKEFGLWAAIREAFPELDAPGAPKLVLPTDETRALPDVTVLALFRASQEAIRNALDHADATTVTVTLDLRDDMATLKVQDDGKGFVVPERLTVFELEDRLGLLSLQERADAQHGVLDVESIPGSGTTLLFRVPIAEAEHAPE